jgi:hypothetical protein
MDTLFPDVVNYILQYLSVRDIERFAATGKLYFHTIVCSSMYHKKITQMLSSIQKQIDYFHHNPELQYNDIIRKHKKWTLHFDIFFTTHDKLTYFQPFFPLR